MSTSANPAVNIGRFRGEFEEAKKALLTCHAGRAHPKDKGFLHLKALAEKANGAAARFNTWKKEGRIAGGVPDERWLIATRGDGKLREFPPDKLWLMLPEKRELTLRGGHVTPQVKDVGPIPFTNPEIFADLGTGYRVIVCFDPSDPAAGAEVFNNEPGVSNRWRYGIGAHICHAEFDPLAPQFSASQGFDDTSKRFHARVRSAFRAIGVFGRPAARADEERDGRGGVVRVEIGAAPTLQDSNTPTFQRDSGEADAASPSDRLRDSGPATDTGARLDFPRGTDGAPLQPGSLAVHQNGAGRPRVAFDRDAAAKLIAQREAEARARGELLET